MIKLKLQSKLCSTQKCITRTTGLAAPNIHQTSLLSAECKSFIGTSIIIKLKFNWKMKEKWQPEDYCWSSKVGRIHHSSHCHHPSLLYLTPSNKINERNIKMIPVDQMPLDHDVHNVAKRMRTMILCKGLKCRNSGTVMQVHNLN